MIKFVEESRWDRYDLPLKYYAFLEGLEGVGCGTGVTPEEARLKLIQVLGEKLIKIFDAVG